MPKSKIKLIAWAGMRISLVGGLQLGQLRDLLALPNKKSFDGHNDFESCFNRDTE